MQALEGIIGQAQGSMDPSVYVDPRSGMQGFAPFLGNQSVRSAKPLVPLSSNVAYQTTNYRIVYQHTLVPWTDQSEFYVSPGALLFGDRYVEKDAMHYYSDFTLATLNSRLRDEWNRFHLNPDMDFQEDVLNKPRVLAALSAYHSRSDLPFSADVKNLYEKATRAKYRHLTKVGILSCLNFLGVVQGRGDTSDDHMREYEQDKISNISIITRGRALVGNIWGGPHLVTHGCQLYLVLTQNKEGMFQVKPRATRGGRLRTKPGDHVWYVGRVKYRADTAPSSHFVTVSSTNKDPVTAYRAVESLPRIEIDVRI